MPPPQQVTRGPMNALHKAAWDGSVEMTAAVLSSRGAPDINQGNPSAATPLMIATVKGFPRVVGALLSKGANFSSTDPSGFSAIHISAQGGKLSITKMFIAAGACLDAPTRDGSTPLHMAANEGHSEVVRALVDAGAKVDCRMPDGATPMYLAAESGHAATIGVLLRAKANPLLCSQAHVGVSYVPLEMAALHGNPDVARVMIKQVGIRGCGGASGGVEALRQAADEEHLEFMAVLVDAGGVVDTGPALILAAENGRAAAVKFLLRRRQADADAYVNGTRDPFGRTPVMCAVDVGADRLCSPKIVRLLVDAGANTARAVGVTRIAPRMEKTSETPLAFTARLLREGRVDGEAATKEQLQRLKETCRLLSRVEAVHAVSWLWASSRDPRIAQATEGAMVERASTTVATPLQAMSPMRRRKPGTRGVLLKALFRW
ncbi:unnamed protein product, partial [Ectocarpus fasciculatus]